MALENANKFVPRVARKKGRGPMVTPWGPIAIKAPDPPPPEPSELIDPLSPQAVPERARAVLQLMIKEDLDDNINAWFGQASTLEDKIKEEFKEDVEKAIVGGYDNWQQNPRSIVSLIILLDYFVRALYRDSPLVMWYNAFAVRVSLYALARQDDNDRFFITPIHMPFVLSPLSHSEDLQHQRLCVQRWQAVSRGLDRGHPIRVFDVLFAQRAHVVHRFQRFPWYNNRLNRVSTQAELDYLEQGGLHFEFPLTVTERGFEFRDEAEFALSRNKFDLMVQKAHCEEQDAEQDQSDEVDMNQLEPEQDESAQNGYAPQWLSVKNSTFSDQRVSEDGLNLQATEQKLDIDAKAKAVLEFAFCGTFDENVYLWFGKSRRVIKRIKDDFAEDVEKAIRGEYSAWQDDPKEAVALLVLLSSFSRALYRNSTRMFWCDTLSERIALDVLKRRREDPSFVINPIHLIFVLLPLSLSEDVNLHRICIMEWSETCSLLPRRHPLNAFAGLFSHHEEVIGKFGRFPHRNLLLHRTSTLSELQWLEAGEHFYAMPLHVAPNGYVCAFTPTHLWVNSRGEADELLREQRKRMQVVSNRKQADSSVPLPNKKQSHHRKRSSRGSLHLLYYIRGNFGELDAVAVNHIEESIENDKARFRNLYPISKPDDEPTVAISAEVQHAREEVENVKKLLEDLQHRNKLLEQENLHVKMRIADYEQIAAAYQRGQTAPEQLEAQEEKCLLM